MSIFSSCGVRGRLAGGEESLIPDVLALSSPQRRPHRRFKDDRFFHDVDIMLETVGQACRPLKKLEHQPLTTPYLHWDRHLRAIQNSSSTPPWHFLFARLSLSSVVQNPLILALWRTSLRCPGGTQLDSAESRKPCL
ncbi:hypothetical protein VTN00DRAFT_5297 [Thermoascus crustaceus]|uniref:uncharacterized protein n=1 Tax=Thermoascus crustaceus TaxID=5088 RepID=UPI0037441BB6